MDLRVKKVRAAFEDAHFPAKSRVQPSQRGDNGGLALPGSRRSDEQRGAVNPWQIRHVLTTPAPAWL